MDQYPDPALVGKAFVKQYYTQMHRDPTQMHRFYLDQSSFVHGGSEIGSEVPVIGQKAIHEKITSLDLQQVHAKIKQVDSHATVGNGIVVQVTGELSISGHPMRAFVQTFVLAPEKPKKYYVHNDIFRYQDDDLVSESETNEAPGEGDNPAVIDQVITDNCDYRSDKDTSVEGGAGEDVRGVYDSQSAELGDSSVNLPVENVPQQTEMTTTTWNQFGEPTHLEVNQNGVDVDANTPQATQEFPSANEPVEVRQEDEHFSVGEPLEQDNKGASTWASRLAQKQQQTSGNRPHNSTAISTSQSLPQREQRPRRTDSNNRPPAQPSATGLRDTTSKKAARDTPDSWQIFVGGLPANTSESDLRNIFEIFGTVTDIRINQKNFAFVVFNGAEPVQNLMALKEPLSLGGKSLNIEPKRRSSGRGDRDRERNRGGGAGGPGKSRSGKPSKR